MGVVQNYRSNFLNNIIIYELIYIPLMTLCVSIISEYYLVDARKQFQFNEWQINCRKYAVFLYLV